MGRPVLSYFNIRAALVSRLMDGDTMSVGRSEYVGASEVGGCPRAVSWAKATERVWVPDPESAGVMLPGRLVENEGVQLLRLMGLDADLRNTGKNQAVFTEDHLRCHPDGLLADEAFDLDPLSTYYDPDGGSWSMSELQPLLVGPGIVEFKSGSSGVFRESIRHGLSLQYQDQTTANMGLSGRKWTLLVFICRDNLARIAFFFLPFREERYRALLLHANAIMGAAALAREAIVMAGLDENDPEDPGVIATAGLHLLAPDEARGYCRKCPLAASCPAITLKGGDAFFPEGVRDEVEALAEIADEAALNRDAFEEERKDATSRLVELGERYGASRAVFAGSHLSSCSITTQDGRLGCNFERLRSLYPAAFEACVSRGDPFPVVRVNRKKGRKS